MTISSSLSPKKKEKKKVTVVAEKTSTQILFLSIISTLTQSAVCKVFTTLNVCIYVSYLCMYKYKDFYLIQYDA